jgi:hypothetical protein
VRILPNVNEEGVRILPRIDDKVLKILYAADEAVRVLPGGDDVDPCAGVDDEEVRILHEVDESVSILPCLDKAVRILPGVDDGIVGRVRAGQLDVTSGLGSVQGRKHCFIQQGFVMKEITPNFQVDRHGKDAFLFVRS